MRLAERKRGVMNKRIFNLFTRDSGEIPVEISAKSPIKLYIESKVD